MIRSDYMKLAEEFTKEMVEVTKVKNADYSRGRENALDNFFTLAERANVTPRQAWNCLFSKHLTAIERWVKDGFVESEGIRGRFLDVAVYCMLGLALATDESERRSAEKARHELHALRPQGPAPSPRWLIPQDLFDRLGEISRTGVTHHERMTLINQLFVEGKAILE